MFIGSASGPETTLWSRCATAAVMLILLVTCTSESEGTPSPAAEASPSAADSASPSPTRRSTHPLFSDPVFSLEPRDEPYAYTTPTPPPDPTPIDGTYLRILTLEDVRGVLPFRCARCPPYLPNAGVSTLVLFQGKYWLNHQLSGFRALGMFTLRGDRITLFNDPWCPQDRGTYRWKVRGGVLTFEAVSGACVYEGARADDLSKAPWTRINPCANLIEQLWPGPLAC